MTEKPHRERIGRRQALKRMAAAGTVVWAAPAVQTLNMSKAYAGTPQVCYTIKFGSGGFCSVPNSNSLTCPVNPYYPTPNGCAQGLTVNTNGPVYGNYGKRTWVVSIPAGYQFVVGWTHGGSRCEQNAIKNKKGPTAVTFYPTSKVPGDGKYAISNVELTFCRR